jgi:hypothetical protein
MISMMYFIVRQVLDEAHAWDRAVAECGLSWSWAGAAASERTPCSAIVDPLARA